MRDAASVGMAAKRDERFPKNLRLVSKKDFDRVFKIGTVASDSMLVIHACRNDLEWTRIGLSISKRVGNSPIRNRWKRLIREAFRKQKFDLPQCLDVVVRPKRGACPDYQQITSSLLRLCTQLGGKLGRNR
jgi:ribonuclease P protein component